MAQENTVPTRMTPKQIAKQPVQGVRGLQRKARHPSGVPTGTYHR